MINETKTPYPSNQRVTRKGQNISRNTTINLEHQRPNENTNQIEKQSRGTEQEGPKQDINELKKK